MVEMVAGIEQEMVGRAGTGEGSEQQTPTPTLTIAGEWVGYWNKELIMDMLSRRTIALILFASTLLGPHMVQAQPRITQWESTSRLWVNDVFTNGVCTLECAGSIDGPWLPVRSRITAASTVSVPCRAAESAVAQFYRVQSIDLTPAASGFGNLVQSFSLLTTIAGAGGSPGDGDNKWLPEFEGGPAADALLSRPHIAMADTEGNVYIADKAAHAIRKVTPEGIIHTVAGTGVAGSGGDDPAPGREVALGSPNGLWVTSAGVVFILDLENRRIRRLSKDGMIRTHLVMPAVISVGRGLWVSDDETLAYVACGTVVKRWTLAEGVTDFSTGYIQLANLVVDPGGALVVTDRGSHQVYRLDGNGVRQVIAGNGTTMGGGDGQPAVQTGLSGVRAVWFLETGAFFLGTHQGSQVWYVDTDGIIHLFLHGTPSRDTHAGDGSHFYAPQEPRVSEVRAVTLDHEGNLLITEHDAGYIRKVRFLPWVQ